MIADPKTKNRFFPIAVVVVPLICLSSVAAAQSGKTAQPSLRFFESHDRQITLQYASSMTVCGGNTADCRGLCHEDDDAVALIACFPYADKLYQGYNFREASLSVGRLLGAKDMQTCTNLPGDKRKSEKINGLAFVSSHRDEGAAGTLLSYTYYRTFQRGECYTAEITVATSNFDLYDPGTIEKFTVSDYQKVYGRLAAVLDTLHIISVR